MITSKTKNVIVEILPRLTWLIQFTCMGFAFQFQNPQISRNPQIIIGLFLLILGLSFLFWSFVVVAKAMVTKALITSGPYQYVRHPIYTSIYLFLIGLGVIFPSIYWFVILIVFVPIWYAIAKAEEWQMTNLYPQIYRTYGQTAGMFWPRI